MTKESPVPRIMNKVIESLGINLNKAILENKTFEIHYESFVAESRMGETMEVNIEGKMIRITVEEI